MTNGRFPFKMISQARVEAFWQARFMGSSLEEIAEDLGVAGNALRRYAKETGGLAPERWKDPDRFLTLEERYRIKELLLEGHSIRRVAALLGRAPSTISRELARAGAGTTGQYRPTAGHRAAWERRRRPKQLKILACPELARSVQQGLEEKLSPEQIIGRLKRDHPGREDLRVCHETIYKSIYLQARGGLKRELAALTRTGRTIRHPQKSAQRRRSSISGMVSIWDRPAEALDRAVPGHWEGDLIVGKDGASAIATIVERHSNFLILGRLDPELNRVQATTAALTAKLGDLPAALRRTLTWDQGTEMAQHQQISIATGIEIYFADPHSPWQRASNENTNGLLRQYFPKGTDLSVYSQEDLDFVADQMNRRPRKRLEFATPYEKLSEHLLR